jgi:hypothetical protein
MVHGPERHGIGSHVRYSFNPATLWLPTVPLCAKSKNEDRAPEEVRVGIAGAVVAAASSSAHGFVQGLASIPTSAFEADLGGELRQAAQQGCTEQQQLEYHLFPYLWV